MGKEKYLKEVEALFRKSPVVTYQSIERVIKHKKKVKQYVKLFIHLLLKKGKIKRLAKGYYTARDDPSLAVFCFQPAYLGLQDALSFHRLWEQETVPVVITSRKVRPGIRKVLGENILIRRIEKKYFFGVEYQPFGPMALPYSDLEKTFLDIIYFKESLGEEALVEFRKRMDRKKLSFYLKKYPQKFRKNIEEVFKPQNSTLL